MDKFNGKAFLNMEIYFNELSVKLASNDEEATRWLKELAELGKLLKSILDSLSEDIFRLRSKEEFSTLLLTPTKNIRDFLIENFEISDPIVNFLFGIFDSPCITPDDPKRSNFLCHSMTFQGKENDDSGLVAAFIKSTLAVSLNSDIIWDTCELRIQINKLEESGNNFLNTHERIKHASKKKHVIDCHLPFLSEAFDWASYKPIFNSENKNQNLLPMLEIYSLYLGENGQDEWKKFYSEISHMQDGERVAKIRPLEERIADIQKWEPATGNLKSKNQNRSIYIIPNSDLVISVDTQHGHFEVFRNQNKPVHKGSISFDGKKFKETDPDTHKLNS